MHKTGTSYYRHPVRLRLKTLSLPLSDIFFQNFRPEFNCPFISVNIPINRGDFIIFHWKNDEPNSDLIEFYKQVPIIIPVLFSWTRRIS